MYSIYKALSPAENHTLSLHDALPISNTRRSVVSSMHEMPPVRPVRMANSLETPGRLCTLRRACKRQTQSAVGTNDEGRQDRKSTRLNSSHANISYAVFCLKKKRKKKK